MKLFFTFILFICVMVHKRANYGLLSGAYVRQGQIWPFHLTLVSILIIMVLSFTR